MRLTWLGSGGERVQVVRGAARIAGEPGALLEVNGPADGVGTTDRSRLGALTR